MWTYLLPGSEFRNKLKEADSNILSTVEAFVFGYLNNYRDRVADVDPVVVDSELSGDINAYITDNGKHVFVLSQNDIHTKDCQLMFYRMPNLVRVVFDNFCTDECTTMHRMFMGCTALPYVNLSHVSSDSVEDFSEMFEDCTSLTAVDLSGFTVTPDDKNENVVNLFKNTPRLRRVSISDEFTYNTSMALSNPSPSYIKDTDGYWHSLMSGNSYTVNDIPSNRTDTYYAIDVNTDVMDRSLVSFGTVKAMFEQMARDVTTTLNMYQDN